MNALRFLSIIWLTLLFAYTLNAQDCPHKGNIDRFENLRVLPPAKITQIDGRTITYSILDVHEVKVGTLTLTSTSVLPKDVYKMQGLWWLSYCVIHGNVYTVTRYEPKNAK